MTATLTRPEINVGQTIHPAVASLSARLETLTADRDAALHETMLSGSGDAADRATNVDAHVRLAVLEERIADVQAELYRVSLAGHDVVGDSSVVRVGSTVTVDFGDGPEAYAVNSVDLAAAGVEVVTPGSPLGRALIGASAGDRVEYRVGNGRTATVEVVAVA